MVSGRVLRNGMGAESLAWTHDVRADAAHLRLLPGERAAGLAASVAWALPPTYVFEGMRALIMEQSFRADLMVEAFALNAVYFAAAVLPSCSCSRARAAHGSLLQTGE